jgi:Flp pilus assembly protein TadG
MEGVSKVKPSVRLHQSYRRNSEEGAEMIEFALIVVLLVTLVYGIITYGLILGTNETMTQSAADAARAGMVYQSATYAIPAAQNTALTDMSWLVGSVNCNTSPGIECQSDSTRPSCPLTDRLCVNVYENAAGTTITAAVTYNYQKFPIVPLVPGLNLVTPSTLSGNATYQIPATAA